MTFIRLVLDWGALPKWLHACGIGGGLEGGAGQGGGEEGGGGDQAAGESLHRSVHLQTQEHHIIPFRRQLDPIYNLFLNCS